MNVLPAWWPLTGPGLMQTHVNTVEMRINVFGPENCAMSLWSAAIITHDTRITAWFISYLVVQLYCDCSCQVWEEPSLLQLQATKRHFIGLEKINSFRIVFVDNKKYVMKSKKTKNKFLAYCVIHNVIYVIIWHNVLMFCTWF